MSLKKWLSKNTASLKDKTVAITGSTGDLGKALCKYLAALGASLILIDRNAERSEAHRAALLSSFPSISVECVGADLSDMESVKRAATALCTRRIHIFIHNAGAYAIPRRKCDTGLDNVFQINFLSPYYLIRRLLPCLRSRKGRVVVVSSIAHDYARSDPNDVDFSTRKRASLVYGNAKRYLTFALAELFKKEEDVTLSLTHPGICFTGITSHYPKPIFALIKYPMKLIFMKPQKACLSTLCGVFCSTGDRCWLEPRFFGIWGTPRLHLLQTADAEERARIAQTAEMLYDALENTAHA